MLKELSIGIIWFFYSKNTDYFKKDQIKKNI